MVGFYDIFELTTDKREELRELIEVAKSSKKKKSKFSEFETYKVREDVVSILDVEEEYQEVYFENGEWVSWNRGVICKVGVDGHEVDKLKIED